MILQRNVELAKGRINVAYDRLSEAEYNLTNLLYRGALHSAYYAAYTSIRVLLSLEYEEQKNHGKNINKFRQHYIKTKLLDANLSEYIRQLYKYRDLGDYDLDFIPKHDEVVEMVHFAKEFVNAVYEYLSEKYFFNKGFPCGSLGGGRGE